MVLAALMTGKGVAAIATVCIVGDDAGKIIKSIFKPIGKNNLTTNEHELTLVKFNKTKLQFETGKIFLGSIVDGQKIIDQVVVGCERKNEFAIHCHGNPLIVELIMELLVKRGAEAISAEQLLEISNFRSKISNRIAVEAKIAQLKAKTIEGYKLLENQIDGGLTAKAKEWIETSSIEQIKIEANVILDVSKVAQYIIRGCKVVIAGPANSGKSTLLNCLAGRDKSIVADIPGTTRDWVSTQCVAGSLAMEVFDTAGLDETLTAESAIDKAAQERSIELIRQADVVIWMIDGSDEKVNFKSQISNLKNQIVVLNKCDLGLKTQFAGAVAISAKNGTGIDELTKRIRIALGVDGFDLKQAVCFTDRQKSLLDKLHKAENKPAADSLITELLNGSVCV
jgi:tRNA modification GTPase